jgi:hypothetical protein
MSMAPQKKNMFSIELYTICRRTIESGIIAVSPLRYSHAIKIAHTPADPQNKPIILALPQGYVVPPHSSARRNIIMAGEKRRKPMKSSVLRVLVNEEALRSFLDRSGIWMNKRSKMDNPPKGRLI